ncbi:MAG TPA: serine hydrolase domain-containing protein [Cyclobacteriaceae bacterium]|nr:serine hydrolase domain-containing protein [Cyclobacteriaceae bacterium]
MKKSILILVILLTGFIAHSQTLIPGKPAENGMSPERLARIDALINDQMNKKLIPGAVVLIARNGKIVFHKAYGYHDVEKQTLLKKDDIFRNASQSKAITSLAVMMLFEEGKFLLDDPISAYIPEFKSPKVLANLNWTDTTYTTIPAKSEITIRQLLTHTSGIGYANIGTQDFNAIYAKAGVPSGIGTDRGLLADKMKILGGLPLKHQPGEAYTYGLNLDVLGYLVEILSGMSFDQFLQTRIFKPLGMNDSYFFLPKEKHGRLVPIYKSSNGALQKVTTLIFDKVDPNYPTLNGTYFSGGAGLNGTIEDYAKFLQLFINKGEYNGVRLLSRKTVELMLTNQIQPPITNQYGLGFGLETEKNDYQNIYSPGSFSWGGAFATQYWADPREKLVGLIYTNMISSPGAGRDGKFKVLTYQAIID